MFCNLFILGFCSMVPALLFQWATFLKQHTNYKVYSNASLLFKFGNQTSFMSNFFLNNMKGTQSMHQLRSNNNQTFFKQYSTRTIIQLSSCKLYSMLNAHNWHASWQSKESFKLGHFTLIVDPPTSGLTSKGLFGSGIALLLGLWSLIRFWVVIRWLFGVSQGGGSIPKI